MDVHETIKEDVYKRQGIACWSASFLRSTRNSSNKSLFSLPKVTGVGKSTSSLAFFLRLDVYKRQV